VTEDEAASAAAVEQGSRNLLMRVIAASVLAPSAIAIAYAGGWLWLGLVTLAAIGLYVEWLTIVAARTPRVMAAGIVTLFGAAVCLEIGRIGATYVIVALGVIIVALLSTHRRGWAALGGCYALAALVASVAVRLDQTYGFTALMFILLVVWVTDIGGYFAGRGLGGPKLWPRVSPKKTWAGAIGGFAASLVVAAGFVAFDPNKGDPQLMLKMGPLLLLGAVLSIATQFGDLFESAVKRRFGVKDSSHIIPGHGGLLDRLDGFVAAVVLAAIFGFLRGGADGVGRGLMVW
jgi:phosphatidate cytidylyltransferase